MVKNINLRQKTASDIDKYIDRLLRDIGEPEPPLNLDVVRDFLKLDRGYYSIKDPGLLQETVHKLRVGAKQVIMRPALLVEAVRKFNLRALYIPDQKRILLDKSQPALKHRWNEAHEIGHSLLPWHEGAMLGDDDTTLIPTCHEKLENEANFAAAKLLFLRERFVKEAKAITPSIDALKMLSKKFGNTNTSTLWRCVEVWGDETPVLGLVTDHPVVRHRKADFDSTAPCRHFIQSTSFAAQFSKLKETAVFDKIVAYARGGKGGPLGGADVLLHDDNGDAHLFEFESFSFHHQTLTICIYRCARATVVAQSLFRR
ncbi:ImmA/IrrE family metallo-endopeptidase [Hyphomonas sp. NPDC076900]|uniref:ImmA/IrrE family metallo-endopeptidase n=1 Tax=unclassified Hyphomonas TaxID=2630699 RepID=UPI003D067827